MKLLATDSDDRARLVFEVVDHEDFGKRLRISCSVTLGPSLEKHTAEQELQWEKLERVSGDIYLLHTIDHVIRLLRRAVIGVERW